MDPIKFGKDLARKADLAHSLATQKFEWPDLSGQSLVFMGMGSSAITDPSDPNYSYSKVFDESMNTLYEGFSVTQIKSDIARFKSSKGLPQDADIVYAQYVGGYSSGNESPSTAIARALAFSQKLDSADRELLVNAATTLSSSNVLKANQVIVRFTFATTSKLGNP